MKDREQFELTEIMERNAKILSAGLMGYCQADFGDLASILVGEGYTRQLRDKAVIMCPHCKTNNERPDILAPAIFCVYCGKKFKDALGSEAEPNPTSLDELRIPPIEPPQDKVEE